jgi:amino acid adenylation domain-containing protein
MRAVQFKYLPLTKSQSAIWGTQVLFSDKSLCNLSGYIDIRAEIEIDRFKDAADRAYAEFEVFHLRFMDTQDGPRQFIDRDSHCTLSFYDLSSESEPEKSANDAMQSDTLRFCDPNIDPLYFVALFKITRTRFYFYIRGHQLIADSYSLKIFVQTVINLYSNPHQDNLQEEKIPGSLEEILVSEENYSESAQYETDETYWRSCLGNKPEAVTLSGKLPTAAASRQSIFVSRTLSENLTLNLHGFAETHATTSRQLILAFITLYLYKYTGETDVMIGLPVDELSVNGIPRQLGILSHVIPLRFILKPDHTVGGLFKQSARLMEEAAVHERFPVESTGIYGALVSVNADKFYPELTGSQSSWHQIAEGPVLDLTVEVSNIQHTPDLQLVLRANSANYTQRSLELHAQRLLDLLARNSAELVNTPISQISLLSDSERNTVIYDWNNTSTEYPTEKCIHELFENQAANSPGAVALAFQGRKLTYSELNAKANRLARYLRQFGVGPDKTVAICVERGMDMILGLLAILKAGGAYVPLDPGFPSDRLEYMLKDSAAAALLSEAATDEHLAALANDIPRINLSDGSAPWSVFSGENLKRSETGVTPSNLVYIIYTSGSTGQPKGVGIHGLNLLNYATFIVRKLPDIPHLKFASVSTIAADLGNTVVFPSLISGGELHIIGLEVATNANLYEQYMGENEIDVLKITPSHFKALFEAKKTKAAVPKTALIFGGERLTSDLVDSIAELSPHCLLYNHYGPTECTVGSIMSLIKKNRDYSVSIPLGFPIANSRIYILDGEDEPVPIGMIGEIYIAGAGVARGYINREQETAKRFKADPFSKNSSDRMYKTGDLGRWLPDGMIEFLGRNDFQVKIRGFRIELGEIESALSLYPEIRETAVIAREEGSSKRLIAYYTSREVLAVERLRTHLLATLPDYMIPALFIRLESMPLTPNGKLDRKALPEPAYQHDGAEVVAPATETEKSLIKEWKKILDSFKPDVSQSFVSIGGDSLSYIGVSIAVEKVLGWLPENWDKLTIKELALLKKDSRQITTNINSTILIRALSIVLIVLDHFFEEIDLVGTTSALFIVSGWSFGRYQINSMYQNDSVRPVLTTIFKIALPVVLYTLFLQLTISSIHPESLFLYDNFIDPFFDNGLSYWYIDVLVQIMLIMTAIFSIRRIRTYAFQNQFVFGLMGALFALAAGLLVNHFWDTDYLYNRLPHIKLWLYFIGIAIASAVSANQKIWLIGTLFIFFFYNAYIQMTDFSLSSYSLFAIIFVILFARIVIPTWLTPLINNIAGASLFIYMTHFQFFSLASKIFVSPNRWAASIFAIIGGVILWKIWEFIYHRLYVYGSKLVKSNVAPQIIPD